jgi:hypothetical protein
MAWGVGRGSALLTVSEIEEGAVVEVRSAVVAESGEREDGRGGKWVLFLSIL